MKRESGASPEQYPLLSSPLWKAHKEATDHRWEGGLFGESQETCHFILRSEKPRE